jgi:hypothetical protein
MRRGATLRVWLILALVAAPIVWFVAYDVIAFQPRTAEIRRLVAAAAPEEKSPPDSIRRVLRVSYPNQLSSHVARLLLEELDAEPMGSSMLWWHARRAAWTGLVDLHLSESDQTTLFLALSPMGNNVRGFSKASTAVVGAPLSTVSVEQAARLVTVGKAPSIYLNNPERLTQQSEALAQRTKNAL